MKRMVIVGTVTGQKYSPKPELIRLYRLDTKAVKDLKDKDLAPVAEKLGVINFADLQIPAVRNLYPMYYTGARNTLLSGADACFVLGTFGAGGYVCIRPHAAHDYIQVIPRTRLVSDVKKGKLYLLNAVIEQVDGLSSDIISPVAGGSWDDMSYLKGRTLVNTADKDTAAGEYTYDERDKIGAEETVEAHDELGMLNAAQKEFLKNYYIEYSIETFNRLVGKSSWTLKQEHEIIEKNKKKRESKIARLAELRTLSNGEPWKFAGLWDVGHVSNRDEHKCEFGHKLRFIYRACPKSMSKEEAQKKGLLLQFGIVCHAEFLNIPPEEVKRLGKLLNTMCSEISFISTVVANQALSKHNALMSSMHDLLGRLQQTGKIQEVLGERLTIAYQGFVSNDLPLVESFVLDTMTKLSEYGVLKVLSAAGIDTSMFAPTATTAYSLPELPVNADSWDKRQYSGRLSHAHNTGLYALERAHEPFPVVLTTYAEKLITNDIAGEYMYNPLHCLTDFVKVNSSTYQRYTADETVPPCHQDMRKYLYGYNSETRELRDKWMRYFEQNTYDKEYLIAPDGMKVRCLTLQGLDRLVELTKRLTAAGLYIDKAVGHETVVKILHELTDVYRYSTDRQEDFADIHPLLLLTALPYTVDTQQDRMCRRAASYKLNSSKPLFDSLDATKDGTDPEYIQRLIDRFGPPILKDDCREELNHLNERKIAVASEFEKVAEKASFNTPVDELVVFSKLITECFNKIVEIVTEFGDLLEKSDYHPDVIQAKDAADRHMYAIKSKMQYVDDLIQKAREAEESKARDEEKRKARETKASKEPPKNPYRGDAAESKRMADEFMSLYENLPKALTSEPTIQIAIDIIKRFRTKFQEKEGFTSKEKWRVNQELERLKRLQAQNGR